MKSMLNHPPFDPNNPLLNKNALDLKFIHDYQNQDHALLKVLKEDRHFTRSTFKNISLIQYHHGPAHDKKIVIP